MQEELGTPALAFVRAVCDALRLDSAVEEEVLELRHNLLRLTHTREFAQAAQFKVLPLPLRSYLPHKIARAGQQADQLSGPAMLSAAQQVLQCAQ